MWKYICCQRSSEFRLLSAAMDAKKPVFGICRGIQVLNTCLGGNLYQDISSQTERIFPSLTSSHFIIISLSQSQHYRKYPASFYLPWQEPDCCKQLPSPKCTYSGTGTGSFCSCSDGIIEAIESLITRISSLGVQWHPEYLWDRDEAAMGLFQAFVDACK